MIKTHDYSKRGWGHDYTFTPVDGGQRGRAALWGEDICAGDYLILQDPQGGTTRYQVETIEKCFDPPDMWIATLVFAPRRAV